MAFGYSGNLVIQQLGSGFPPGTRTRKYTRCGSSHRGMGGNVFEGKRSHGQIMCGAAKNCQHETANSFSSKGKPAAIRIINGERAHNGDRLYCQGMISTYS